MFGPISVTDSSVANIVVSSTGEVYVYKSSGGLLWDQVKKFDASGSEDTVNWNKPFPTQSGGKVMMGPSDSVYVILNYTGSVYRFDANGSPAAVGSNFQLPGAAQGSMVIPGGIMVIVGVNPSFVLRKFDLSGAEDTLTWSPQSLITGSSSPAVDVFFAATDSAGNIFVSGRANNLVSASSGQDIWLRKFSPSGVEDSVNWNKSYSSTGAGNDVPAGLLSVGAKLYLVASGMNLVSSGGSGRDWWIKKFD